MITMDEILTMDMLLELPRKIEEEAKKYSETTFLLPKEICNEFDIKTLKEKISHIFNHYQNIRYLSNFSDYKITASYELKENMFLNNISDKVGNLVEKQIDEQLWASDFYHRLISLSKKLSESEVVYLI